MNNISNSQLFALMFGVKTFSLICSGVTADASQMAGAAISIIAQFLLAIPMMTLYRREGFSLKKEMLFGKFGKCLYALFFIVWGAVSNEAIFSFQVVCNNIRNFGLFNGGINIRSIS